MTTQHSRLGASSMERWATCPGSVRLSDGIRRRSSRYAGEGTAAHSLAAACLENGKDAADYLGHMVGPDEAPFLVDEDMAGAGQVYLDAVRAAWATPEPGVLVVFDYKHGAGVPVEVEKNLQLIFYAFGALYTTERTRQPRLFLEHRFTLPDMRPDLGGTCDAIIKPAGPIRRVRLVVVQPRCGHPDGPVRTWEFDALDLLDWRQDLLDAAARTDDPKAPLVAGDHCKFCPAARLCPELEKRQHALVALEFKPLTAGYDAAKLAEGLNMIEALEARIKAMREFAYEEASAGRQIPGWKLVQKRATRKWVDEDAAAATLTNKEALGHSEIYTEKLISPAQAEKLLGKKRAKEILADLVVAESSGAALVPESDPRPPVAQIEFKPLAIGD